MSELPGVVIMRVVDEKGDKESITCQHKEAYVALSRPSVFESDEGFCDALRSGWRVIRRVPTLQNGWRRWRYRVHCT